MKSLIAWLKQLLTPNRIESTKDQEQASLFKLATDEANAAKLSLERIIAESGEVTSMEEAEAVVVEGKRRIAAARSLMETYPFLKITGLEKIELAFNRLEQTCRETSQKIALAEQLAIDEVPPLSRVTKHDSLSTIVAIVDTETTGLEAHDEAISIGIILFEVSMPKGTLVREIGSYYGLQEPSVPINPGAAAVHGMSLEVLRGKSFDMPEVVSLLMQADVIVAHYALFDYRMLIKLHPPLRDAVWGCSCLALRNYWSEMPNRKLDTICLELGVTRPNPHNAMTDCRALAEVLFMNSGSTKRSRTYMGHLAARPWMPTS